MSKPNLSVAVEPFNGTSVVYEPVAPKDTNSQGLALLCLELSITNHENSIVHLNQVSLSFSSPPSVPDSVISVPPNWGGAGVNIAPGATGVWNFVRAQSENDTVVLPAVAPASFTLSLFFDGFSSPWTVSLPLAAHQNPVPGGSYVHPARFDDLRAGEFWVTSSNSHGTGAEGSQLFAYDNVVWAYDASLGSVSRLLPGTNGSKNDDYRVWGKKIHAMADGTVAHFLDGVDANPNPGQNSNGPWQQPPWDNPTKAWDDHVGAGNHFYLRHGSEVVLYAHMQKGTLNPNLLALNAPVKAGDFLGLAGNAGSSSEPHLHIHAIHGTEAESGPLRPLLFHDVFAIDPSDLKSPNISGPWERVQGQGPPVVAYPGAFMWPLGRNPQWRGWEDLGGPIKSGPAVAAWAANRLDVFATGANGQLNHKWWNGSSWSAWQNLGGTFKGAPAAVSWGPNRIDLFVQGMDDHLGHFWWDGSQWRGWEDLGGPIKSGPAVAAWAANRLDVFAGAGTDGQLYHKWWDGSTWNNWDWVGGYFQNSPAAVSWGPNRIDVFVQGSDNNLGHLWWD
jgi:hypothetical protein